MTSKQGTYALILEANQPFGITVGRLGRFRGDAGTYVYCGSAFGPGGVEARTAHHRRISCRPHWHIDYLKPATTIREIWFSHDPKKREHDWTQVFLSDTGMSVPLPGFGSTDCGCSSHLLYSVQPLSFHRFVRKAHRLFENHQRISRLILRMEKHLK